MIIVTASAGLFGSDLTQMTAIKYDWKPYDKVCVFGQGYAGYGAYIDPTWHFYITYNDKATNTYEFREVTANEWYKVGNLNGQGSYMKHYIAGN